MNDRQPARTRALAATAAALTVATGLAVHETADGEVAKYAGDALYAVMVYTLVLLTAPRTRPLPTAACALALCTAVELFKLTGIPEALALRTAIAPLILGTTFNPPNLLWYTAGAALPCLIHHATPSAPPPTVG